MWKGVTFKSGGFCSSLEPNSANFPLNNKYQLAMSLSLRFFGVQWKGEELNRAAMVQPLMPGVTGPFDESRSKQCIIARKRFAKGAWKEQTFYKKATNGHDSAFANSAAFFLKKWVIKNQERTESCLFCPLVLSSLYFGRGSWIIQPIPVCVLRLGFAPYLNYPFLSRANEPEGKQTEHISCVHFKTTAK